MLSVAPTHPTWAHPLLADHHRPISTAFPLRSLRGGGGRSPTPHAPPTTTKEASCRPWPLPGLALDLLQKDHISTHQVENTALSWVKHWTILRIKEKF